jgi:DNA anti-recombination protein RmuC
VPAQQAWDRRANETGPAWEAFRTYLDQGSGRSHAEVVRRLGKSTALIERWSSRHDWVDRVAAYEAHEVRLKDEAAFSVITQRERARKMAEQAQLSQEALTQIDVAFLQRINEMRRRNEDPFKDISTDALARLVALAARARRGPAIIERLSRNMSTENLAGADGQQLPGVDWVAGKSEAELEAFLTETLSGDRDDEASR